MLQALIGPIASILDKFIPDADTKQKLAHEISTMAENHAQQIALAQIKVNEAEASSTGPGSLFKGGWRPACGWICVISLGYTYILQPFLVFILLAAGVDLPDIPTLDTNALLPILLGMLGLAGARSFDRYTGGIPKGK
tara:strand:- start:2304 stop:2717 length:414 start_codon:yes stop_codon:yes gene_type:complete